MVHIDTHPETAKPVRPAARDALWRLLAAAALTLALGGALAVFGGDHLPGPDAGGADWHGNVARSTPAR